MARGLRKEWFKGPRSIIEAVDNRGQRVVRLGKRGGPVIQQIVELRLIPKEKA